MNNDNMIFYDVAILNFEIFSILRNLTSLELPNDIDLFPSDVYGWLLPRENNRDIKSTLHDAVVHGAVDW